MCGITGFWNHQFDDTAEKMRKIITSMTQAMYRRGPDSGGAWIDPKSGIAFGHRRLAIRDISPTGYQPMSTDCGQYVLTYNGEVYNAEELREDLRLNRGVHCHGTSDTEVILHACASWGVERTVKRLIGMFAFAFWDRTGKKLTLARDRLGIKPLYWGRIGKLFLFGSELKSLCQHNGWKKDINRDAVAELMRCCYISAPLSIYEGIEKLRQGHLLEIDANGKTRDICYWDARKVMKEGLAKKIVTSDKELIDQLDHLLRDAVKRRMISDVPLGAFLSGGIDSSLVTALMQAQSETPVRTFSIGFEECEYNEAHFAKAVANHLGTKHTEEYMTPKQAWESIPLMAEFYDEPFADSSQLPTYLLSAITRKNVTVALSGDGGDELFGGYERYFNFLEKFPQGKCPEWKRMVARTVAPLLSPQNWDRVARLLPSKCRPAKFGMRLHGFAKRSGMPSSALYRQIGLAHWPEPAELVIGSREVKSIFDDRTLEKEIPDVMDRMRFLDSVHYLPDDILVKLDRATMGVSLEARVPIIDHRVYAFAWQLPSHLLVREGQGKWILRQVLYKYVPRKLVDRPKMGFGVPINHWLRGPLRNWAEDLLEPGRLKREGFIRPDIVTTVWQKHLSGNGDWHYWLWDVLMFQSWLGLKDTPVAVPNNDSLNLKVVVAS